MRTRPEVTRRRQRCERDGTRTLTEQRPCIRNWKEIGDEAGRRTRLRFSAAATIARAHYPPAILIWVHSTLLYYYYYYFDYLCQLARQMAMLIGNVPCVFCACYAYTYSVECTTLVGTLYNIITEYGLIRHVFGQRWLSFYGGR